MLRPPWFHAGFVAAVALSGCATHKESHTARTGVEQLLISSAIDRSLDKFDLKPLSRQKVFLETKYLDCVDKNYVIVSMHHRLLANGSTLVDKSADADVILEIASGAVGTDGEELFVGIPEIPLPPPSPISIPRFSVFTRTKTNGTAKLLLVAYNAKTKEPAIYSGAALARSDQKNWNLLGSGTFQTGSVPNQIAAATKEPDFNVMSAASQIRQVVAPTNPTEGAAIQSADFVE